MNTCHTIINLIIIIDIINISLLLLLINNPLRFLLRASLLSKPSVRLDERCFILPSIQSSNQPFRFRSLQAYCLALWPLKQGFIRSIQPRSETVGLSKEHPATRAYLGKASGVLHLLKGRLDETTFLVRVSSQNIEKIEREKKNLGSL
jgi:hypothetical protein